MTELEIQVQEFLNEHLKEPPASLVAGLQELARHYNDILADIMLLTKKAKFEQPKPFQENNFWHVPFYELCTENPLDNPRQLELLEYLQWFFDEEFTPSRGDLILIARNAVDEIRIKVKECQGYLTDLRRERFRAIRLASHQ